VVNKFREPSGFGSNHLIKLAAAVGEEDFAIRLVRTNQYYRNYRWLVTDPDMATFRNSPAFRELLNELYARWQRDVAELGPSFPAPSTRIAHASSLSHPALQVANAAALKRKAAAPSGVIPARPSLRVPSQFVRVLQTD
jgi:hypothetical protein